MVKLLFYLHRKFKKKELKYILQFWREMQSKDYEADIEQI